MKITNEKLLKIYTKEFPENMTFAEVAEKFETFTHPHADELRQMFCNTMLCAISEGIVEYAKGLKHTKDSLLALFLKQIEKLPEEYVYYHAIYQFFQGNQKECMKLIKKELQQLYKESKKGNLAEFYCNEAMLVDCYIVPYKKAFPGFWEELAAILKKYPGDVNITELCKLIGAYYECECNEEKAELLQEFILRYPEFSTPKELLGTTYQEMRMWRNAIACFESVEEEPVYFYQSDLFWLLAWSYGKCRDYRNEERYYRKVKELAPGMPFLNNNLAYCLYKQKRYVEAKECIQICIDEKLDMPFAANNYVRILIALGRNKDAKDFQKNSGFKIDKHLAEKVKKLEATNARSKKNAEISLETQESDDETAVSSKEALQIKGEQFSNEKLLEDELTARIENGIPVFGKKLKIYRRKGEYGRQYIIPIGRLDLLCEDEEGNLYVIELKKDSGYDDAYQQTADYLSWFEKNKISGKQKVYGIICLNRPTQQLLDKVHADERMKIFEYQISYTERKQHR